MRISKLPNILVGLFAVPAIACIARLFALRGLWLSQSVTCAILLFGAGLLAGRPLARNLVRSRIASIGLTVLGTVVPVLFAYLYVSAAIALALGAFVSGLCLSAALALSPALLCAGVVLGAVALLLSQLAGAWLPALLAMAGGLLVLVQMLRPRLAETTVPAAEAAARNVPLLVYRLALGLVLGGVFWSLTRVTAVSLRSAIDASATVVGVIGAGALAGTLLGRRIPPGGALLGLTPLPATALAALLGIAVAFFPSLLFSEATVLQVAPRFLIPGRTFPVLIFGLIYGMLLPLSVRGLEEAASRLGSALVMAITIVSAASWAGLGTGLRLRLIVTCAAGLVAVIAGQAAFRRTHTSRLAPALATVLIAALVAVVAVADPWWRELPSRFLCIDYSESPPFRIKQSAEMERVRSVQQVRLAGRRALPDGLLTELETDTGLGLRVFGGMVIGSSEARSQAAVRLVAHLPALIHQEAFRVGVLFPAGPVLLEGLRTHAEASDAEMTLSVIARGPIARTVANKAQELQSSGEQELDCIVVGPTALTVRLDSLSLMSHEPLRRLVGRLSERGSLICWLPTRGVTVDRLAATLSAVRSVVPEVYVFLVGDELVVLGARKPVRIPYRHASRLWRHTGVQEYMLQGGFWSLDSAVVTLSMTPAAMDRLDSVAAPLLLWGVREPRLRRDLCDLSRPECIALVWQYRTMTAKMLPTLFSFDLEAEERMPRQAMQKGHEVATLQTLKIIKRLTQYKSNSERFAVFLGSRYLDSEMFGGEPAMEPRIRRATAYARLGFYGKALGALHEAIAAGGATADIFAHIGHIHELQYQYENARQAYRRALDYDAEHPDTLRGLARLALAEGKWIEASTLLAKSLRQDPDHIGTLMTLSRIYGKQGKYDQARLLLERVLALDPANEAAQRELALYKREETPPMELVPDPADDEDGDKEEDGNQ